MAKTSEVDSLRRQLAEATAQAAHASVPAAAVAPAASAELESVLAQNKRLQSRVTAIEEEKNVMLENLRENIKTLARENYDLRHGKQKQVEQTPAASSTSTPLTAPKQVDLDADTSADTPSVSQKPASGGGFLSFVLSPF